MSTKSQKEKVAEAGRMHESGNLEEELKIRMELAKSYPNNKFYRARLGNAYWDGGDLKNAEKEFQAATELAPGSETCSLGLFHVLWEQDRQQEAVEEADRFLSISHTDEYLRSKEYEEYSALIKKIKAHWGEDRVSGVSALR